MRLSEGLSGKSANPKGFMIFWLFTAFEKWAGVCRVSGIEALEDRASLLRQLRSFFDGRGFLEVQPPCIAAHSIIDPYIDPIEVETGSPNALSRETAPRYLQTSPELWMKQLLAASAPSIYAITPAFRADEVGDLHRMEFTMLEWYEVEATETQGIELLGQLACQILGHSDYEVKEYRAVFHDYLGVDPIRASLSDLTSIAEVCDTQLARSLSSDRDGLLDLLLSERIQPKLGIERPLILRNYPLSQAALAKASHDDGECAARFELYVDGIELGNGYDELRDAVLLRQRLEKVDQQRRQGGRKSIAPMPDSIASQISDGLPQCTGVALGVDRLHLVRSGKTSLDEVSAFRVI